MCSSSAKYHGLSLSEFALILMVLGIAGVIFISYAMYDPPAPTTLAKVVASQQEFEELTDSEWREWVTQNIDQSFVALNDNDLVVVSGGPKTEVYDFKEIVWNGILVRRYDGSDKLIELSELGYKPATLFTKKVKLIRRGSPAYTEWYDRRNPLRW